MAVEGPVGIAPDGDSQNGRNVLFRDRGTQRRQLLRERLVVNMADVGLPQVADDLNELWA
jgi:hypothetical protein